MKNTMYEVVVTAKTRIPILIENNMGGPWAFEKGQVVKYAGSRHYFKSAALERAERLRDIGCYFPNLVECKPNEISVRVRKVAR